MTTTIEEQTTPRGLFVAAYLPRLDDGELADLVAYVNHGHDAAPTFCGWLSLLLSDEQLRRLKNSRGENGECEAVVLPCRDWTNQDLLAAINVATALSFTVPGYEAGHLVDRLCMALNALIAERLTKATP